MTSGFKILNISSNTNWNCNFSLPFKHLPLKLHVIQERKCYNSFYNSFRVSGLSVLQQVIIRFHSWSHRTLIYKSRKKFKVDPTKWRNDLLKKERDLTENIAVIQYVFQM